MPKRNPSNQTKHDQKVRREANKLKAAGWDVKADLPGFEHPRPIGLDERVPDIEASKMGAVRLIEVETEDTLKADKEQQSTFRRSAAHRKKATFKIEEA